MKGSFTLWCKVEALFEVGGSLEELKVTSEGSNSLINETHFDNGAGWRRLRDIFLKFRKGELPLKYKQ